MSFVAIPLYFLGKTEAQTNGDKLTFAGLARSVKGVLFNLHIKGTLWEQEPSANTLKT